MSMPYRAAMMLGRLTDGAQRDHGTLVHAVRRKEVPSPRIPEIKVSVEVSLCGKRPGRWSVGWTGALIGEKGYIVNCPRCLKRLEKDAT